MDHAVLLVDDDVNLLSGLRRALHKQPFQIYTARNAEEATLILKTRNIDVLVTDEAMPGMCGADLAAWVAETCPQVMRIMLTGHAELKTAMRAINELGVRHFFTKPCNEVRLAMAIQTAIEEKDAEQANRQTLDWQQQQLRELKRRQENLELQARWAAEELPGPLQTLLDRCRRLQERLEDSPDLETRRLLADADKAARACRELALRLSALASSEPAPPVDAPAAPPFQALAPATV